MKDQARSAQQTMQRSMKWKAGSASGVSNLRMSSTAEHLHDVWREVAPLLGLMYSRERLQL